MQLSLAELESNNLSDALKHLHRFNARRKIRAVFRTVGSQSYGRIEVNAVSYRYF
jgi:hypothetical protein